MTTPDPVVWQGSDPLHTALHTTLHATLHISGPLRIGGAR